MDKLTSAESFIMKTQNIKLTVFEQAKLATCNRAHCGSIVVSENDEIIGTGFNSPAGEVESQRMCNIDRSSTIKPKYDRTCCMHAEWRAIMNALKNHPDKIVGSTLHFIRLDVKTEEIIPPKDLFCTVCSRLILDSGISKVILYSEDSQVGYDSEEYNLKSYQSLLPNLILANPAPTLT